MSCRTRNRSRIASRAIVFDGDAIASQWEARASRAPNVPDGRSVISRLATEMQLSTNLQVIHHASARSIFRAMLLTVSECTLPVAANRAFSMMSTFGEGSLADMVMIADTRGTIVKGLSSSFSIPKHELRVCISIKW